MASSPIETAVTEVIRHEVFKYEFIEYKDSVIFFYTDRQSKLDIPTSKSRRS